MQPLQKEGIFGRERRGQIVTVRYTKFRCLEGTDNFNEQKGLGKRGGPHVKGQLLYGARM